VTLTSTENGERLRLLVVDATTGLEKLLREAIGADVEIVTRGAVSSARRTLLERPIDCIVLDIPTPSGQGLEKLEAVLSSASDVPVVVIADDDGASLALHAIHGGAQDYLVRLALDPGALGRAIRFAIERKRAEAHLAHQALHDSLTGLPNRVLMLDRLNVALGRSRRRPTSLGVLFLDLDGFKAVNDSHGHEAGDDLLVEVARRLARSLRPGDTVARFGGDEFVILCEDLRGQREAVRVAERARAAVSEPFHVRGHEVTVRASIGIVCARRGQTHAQDLIREADVAMYRAKRDGSGVELFQPTMNVEAMNELETEEQLRGATERGELRIHYQPVVALGQDAAPLMVEALVRWEQPERGLLTPIEFLSLSEETGLIAQIDAWVLGEACLQLARWRDAGLAPAGLKVTVNFSRRSLTSPVLVEAVGHALAAAGLPAGCLCLEVTETSVDRDPARMAAVLGELKRLGVTLSLDDFGTGYSSLSALSDYGFDVVKIDRFLVESATADPAAARMLGAVLGVVHAAGLEAVAEGIETAPQLEVIRELGCDAAQGYLFAEPGTHEDIGMWLASRTE
jgi:diguanylate cyclase (GGDEF)-like protein